MCMIRLHHEVYTKPPKLSDVTNLYLLYHSSHTNQRHSFINIHEVNMLNLYTMKLL